jgi:hypothetical protein
MTTEDQKRLTEYHNKMVRDKHEIESLTTENARLREALEGRFPLAFIEWYSGMEKEKILRAFERWKNVDPLTQALTEKLTK